MGFLWSHGFWKVSITCKLWLVIVSKIWRSYILVLKVWISSVLVLNVWTIQSLSFESLKLQRVSFNVWSYKLFVLKLLSFKVWSSMLLAIFCVPVFKSASISTGAERKLAKNIFWKTIAYYSQRKLQTRQVVMMICNVGISQWPFSLFICYALKDPTDMIQILTYEYIMYIDKYTNIWTTNTPPQLNTIKP